VAGKSAAIAEHRVPLTDARRKLLTIWAAGAGILLGVSGFRSATGYYEDPQPLWNWLLPALAPNLSLIVGSVMYPVKSIRRNSVDRLAFRVAVTVSAAYLATMSGILLIGLSPLGNISLSELTSRTGALLALANGLVSLTLGRFFTSQ
jgi:hypothetical protein